jgi:hypothetical protein
VSKFDHNGEGYSRQNAVNQLYKFNKSESEDIGGQGQYVNWNDLTANFRERVKEQNSIIDAGFDYGRHEDSMKDGGGGP